MGLAEGALVAGALVGAALVGAAVGGFVGVAVGVGGGVGLTGDGLGEAGGGLALGLGSPDGPGRIGARITNRRYHSDGPRVGVTALRRQPGMYPSS